ncbi:GNAT family N-acetyltransferase [Candidatus Halocynthiibacter alkanivorans]|uniref:GNAT family N-acetyltransferase n=1 Tax=Candidatus Halocynthiibacter alkanivorans TaxID=2267619 RepID=UPI000DF2BA5F|nr:GNAT family N-acetyltransferase [Candidatus Halocynthiibacter alkanivorans]
MHNFRRATPDDLNALYRISLRTGHLGADARHLYADPKLMGHIYSAPYLKFSPDLAMVVERHGQVLGFCIGAANTRDFERRLEAAWWPGLRWKLQKPLAIKRSEWTADERRCQMIHEPEIAPEHVCKSFPAHLHMNLLPEIQGQDIGHRLLQYWMERAIGLGISAVHVGANVQNQKAVRFWQRQGFRNLVENAGAPGSRTVWLGRSKL